MCGWAIDDHAQKQAQRGPSVPDCEAISRQSDSWLLGRLSRLPGLPRIDGPPPSLACDCELGSTLSAPTQAPAGQSLADGPFWSAGHDRTFTARPAGADIAARLGRDGQPWQRLQGRRQSVLLPKNLVTRGLTRAQHVCTQHVLRNVSERRRGEEGRGRGNARARGVGISALQGTSWEKTGDKAVTRR